MAAAALRQGWKISYGFAATPVVAATSTTALGCLAFGLPRAFAEDLPHLASLWAEEAEAEELLELTSPPLPTEVVVLVVAERSPIQRIFDVLAPRNIGNIVLRNVMLAYAFAFNAHMLTLLAHENEALQLEQDGLEPPPAPPVPPMRPPLDQGLYFSARELLVQLVRRIYEWRLVASVGKDRAGPFLRDSKAWIRDVLVPENRSVPKPQRFYKYFMATLHAQFFFYCAECTVATAHHAHSSYTRTKHLQTPRRVAHFAKGAALHVARCVVTLLAVSAGAAVGGLVWPTYGLATLPMVSDYGVGMCSNMVMASVLQLPVE